MNLGAALRTSISEWPSVLLDGSQGDRAQGEGDLRGLLVGLM